MKEELKLFFLHLINQRCQFFFFPVHFPLSLFHPFSLSLSFSLRLALTFLLALFSFPRLPLSLYAPNRFPLDCITMYSCQIWALWQFGSLRIGAVLGGIVSGASLTQLYMHSIEVVQVVCKECSDLVSKHGNLKLIFCA